MKVSLKKTFLKDLTKVGEPHKTKVKTFIEELYQNPNLLENMKNTVKIKGEKNFYRLRFGDYRLGFEK